MLFYYHKKKYKTNNNYQINNLLSIMRNQLINNLEYSDFKLPDKQNINIKKINKYKHIRNNYLNKYSYMNINLKSLFFQC